MKLLIKYVFQKISKRQAVCHFESWCATNLRKNVCVCVCLCVIGGFLRQWGEQTAGLWAEILSAITTSNELHCIALRHLHGG